MTRRARSLLSMVVATVVATTIATSASAAPPDKLKQFRVPTSGSSPEHIVRATDGNFWFTESFINNPNAPGKNIGRITPAGQVTEFQVCTDCFPTDIVQGSDGVLYFTKNDAALGRITTAGVPMPDIGTFVFNGNGLAADGNNIWISDFNNAVMHRYNVVTGVFTSFTIPAPSLDVTVDHASGTVWFTQTDSRIGRLNPATGVVTEISLADDVREINIASDGFVWFTERFASMVGRINPATNVVVGLFAVGGGPEDIAPTAGGSMWFTRTTTGDIQMISPAGVITNQSKAVRGTEPTGITVAPDGNPWFTMLAADKIATLQLT
jgi:streptogramin lyase